jgi:hypothetical protein
MEMDGSVTGHTEPPVPQSVLPGEPDELRQAISAAEPRNMMVLAIHQILVRIGWIFKTESVIMPAFVDTIAGAGWVRGFLPVLNRMGQSVPPLFFVRQLEGMPRKKWAMITWSVMMGLPFLALSAIWFFPQFHRAAWLPPVFLLMYTVFFAYTGLNQLVLGTLQGKLIQPTRRGRLLGMSAFGGAVLAVAFAIWLLGGWLARPDGGFMQIFGFTGVCFVLSGLSVLPLVEPPDAGNLGIPPSGNSLSAAWQVFRDDANFRRLAVVVMLFSGMQLLFPHYQALARERLQLFGDQLMLWVVTQNAATGIFGLVLGPLGDRKGNRLALGATLFCTAIAPLLAIGLAHLDPAWGRQMFWLVFLPVGLTPLAMKTLTNYTLEIAPVEDHPRYLNTVNLVLALPYVFSPVVGWLADVTSFELVFLTGSALILLAAVWTFRLDEPRHRSGAKTPVVPRALEE